LVKFTPFYFPGVAEAAFRRGGKGNEIAASSLRNSSTKIIKIGKYLTAKLRLMTDCGVF